MRVKIGDTWYNSDNQPICLELEGADKENIANMFPDATKYAVAPDGYFKSNKIFMDWMD